MYLPNPFNETHPEEIQRIICEHPLGMLVTHGAAGLDANHLPFLLDTGRGPHGTLLAHLARANPVLQSLSDGAPVLVVFRGAHGYISPNWYPSKQDTHRHVPTWNYEAVHAHGHVLLRNDEKFLLGVVGRLTKAHEEDQPTPWRLRDAPADYLAALLAQIVGIEIEITRIECSRKLSQNREPRDFASTVSAVDATGNHALAQAMRRTRGS